MFPFPPNSSYSYMPVFITIYHPAYGVMHAPITTVVSTYSKMLPLAHTIISATQYMQQRPVESTLLGFAIPSV